MWFVHQKRKYLFQATGILYHSIKLKSSSSLMFNVYENKCLGNPNTLKQMNPTKYTQWCEKNGWLHYEQICPFAKVRIVLLLTGNLRWTTQNAALFIKALLPSGGSLAFQHWRCWFDLTGCSWGMQRRALPGKIKTWTSSGPRCHSSDDSRFSLCYYRMEDSGEVMRYLDIFCPERESVFYMAYLRKLLLAVLDW